MLEKAYFKNQLKGHHGMRKVDFKKTVKFKGRSSDDFVCVFGFLFER
jgi:hypothetical protein